MFMFIVDAGGSIIKCVYRSEEDFEELENTVNTHERVIVETTVKLVVSTILCS